MAVALTDLVATRTQAQWRQQLLSAMQGVGHTQHTVGSGLGAVYGIGVPTSAVTLTVRIVGAGGLGSALFQYSTDGGSSWSSSATVPAAGLYLVPGLGVSLVFDASNAASVVNAYILGDQYELVLTITTLPVTAWQPGSVPLTLLEADADVLADLSQLQQAVAKGGLLATAEGPWLELLAYNVYGLSKYLATAAAGVVALTAIAGVGPYTIAARQLIFATAGGVRFTNTAGGVLVGSSSWANAWTPSTAYTLGARASNGGNVYTVTAGGVSAAAGGPSGTGSGIADGTVVWTYFGAAGLQLPVQAVNSGAAGNVGNGTVTSLLTPLAGVTVANPDPGTGTWLTAYGRDDEQDAALRQRCRDRWPSLGVGGTAAQYDAWARAASGNVVKTVVYADPVVAGQVDVVVAGAAGPVSAPELAAVQAYITARVPLTSAAVVANASVAVVTVTAAVYVSASHLVLAQQQCPANLQALIAATPIGGTVYLSEVVSALGSVSGVRNVVVTSPVADVVLTSAQVATLTSAITFTVV
jgi:uncharacterized phage protein gp47/JayE